MCERICSLIFSQTLRERRMLLYLARVVCQTSDTRPNFVNHIGLRSRCDRHVTKIINHHSKAENWQFIHNCRKINFYLQLISCTWRCVGRVSEVRACYTPNSSTNFNKQGMKTALICKRNPVHYWKSCATAKNFPISTPCMFHNLMTIIEQKYVLCI